MDQKFYYHKLGTKNSLAEEWLEQGKSPIGKHAIAIFWGNITKNDIAKRKLTIRSKQQAYDFHEAGLKKNHNKTIVILIFNEKIWFVKPTGGMQQRTFKVERKNKRKITEIVKLIPVEIVKSIKISKIPPILAGITANAYVGRGTFREITNWGNIKAIYTVLGKKLPKEHLENPDSTKLLECLGSVELETLVAKIFEANGCFVPAYRGGNLKDVDLFVHNYQKNSININGLEIKRNEAKTIQIKGKKVIRKPENVDYFIGYGAEDMKNCFDSEWIIKSIAESKSDHLKEWFKLSLDWLPNNFSKNYSILK